ncbi:ATP-binding protein, partial [Streptomyces alfalfae]
MRDVDRPETVSQRFPEAPTSAAAARQLVRAALGGIPAEPTDTAELLVGELVTNAVLHARTEVEVSVQRQDGRIRVRVSDDPVPYTPLTLPTNRQVEISVGADTRTKNKKTTHKQTN